MGDSTMLTVPDVLELVRGAFPRMVAVAETLPLPGREEEERVVTVLHFGQPCLQGKEIMYPPRQMTVVSLETKRVLRSEPCEPRTFGIEEDHLKRFTSFGLRDVSAAEFWKAVETIRQISPRVWELYFRSPNRLAPDEESLLATYRASFRKTTYVPLLPYLSAVAGDFIAWVEAMT